MCSGKRISVHITSSFSVSCASMTAKNCMQSEQWTPSYLDNKATISLYKYIGYIIVKPIHFNNYLLIVNWEFFLTTPTVRRSSGWIVSFPICRSFKLNVGREWIDKQTIWKCACGSHGTKATIKYRERHRITFGAGISDNDRITFDSVNALCHIWHSDSIVPQ